MQYSQKKTIGNDKSKWVSFLGSAGKNNRLNFEHIRRSPSAICDTQLSPQAVYLIQTGGNALSHTFISMIGFVT